MTWLRPAARCPKCGTRPRLRIPTAERDRAQQVPPEEPLATYQCHKHLDGGRECGCIYPLTAEAYRQAA